MFCRETEMLYIGEGTQVEVIDMMLVELAKSITVKEQVQLISPVG